MNKKLVILCLFVIGMLSLTPAISASVVLKEQSVVHKVAIEKQGRLPSEKPEAMLGVGYLLVHVFAFTRGMGFYSYQGAFVTVKGFLYSYNGTTDENGDIVFTVQTKLFRPKLYFITVIAQANNRTMTRMSSIFIERKQIVYKEFLFLIPQQQNI